MEKTGSKHTKATKREISDKELVCKALERDQSAFGELLNRYRKPLLAHIQQYVTNTEDAEDICQRSFAKAFMSIGSFNPQFAFSTWLYNIAKNESLDHLRHQKSSLNPVSLPADSDSLFVCAADTPEEKVIVDQAVSDIITNIRNLPENYRSVAELRFIHDYAYEDIADELKLPIGTVKTRLNRARKILTGKVEIQSGDERDR